MFNNPVLDLWKKDSVVVNGWLSVPNSFLAEAMGNIGWDTLTIDMQHGLNSYSTSISMIQAISNSSAIPFVRVPWNEPGIIMKMLDVGTCGIIAPMINTKEECERFVSYCRYPPLGQRSFGPMRAQLIYRTAKWMQMIYCQQRYQFGTSETARNSQNVSTVVSRRDKLFGAGSW